MAIFEEKKKKKLNSLIYSPGDLQVAISLSCVMQDLVGDSLYFRSTSNFE